MDVQFALSLGIHKRRIKRHDPHNRYPALSPRAKRAGERGVL